MKDGRVDLIDIYSTDAKVGRYALRVLVDDRLFFPKYDAVLLMRAAVDPTPLRGLEGRIDAATMIGLNARAELDGVAFAEVARAYLAGGAGVGANARAERATFLQRLFAPDFGRLAMQHLLLVFGSLLAAVVVGVPLGITAWRWPRLASWVLGAVAVLQTVPSLALLAFLIALVGGIGLLPALIALFLYALLPIVRNTHTGLSEVPAEMGKAALALGLPCRRRCSRCSCSWSSTGPAAASRAGAEPLAQPIYWRHSAGRLGPIRHSRYSPPLGVAGKERPNGPQCPRRSVGVQ